MRRTKHRSEPPSWRGVAFEVARLAVMLLGTVVLQSTIAPHVRIMGSTPSFTLLAVVCVGLLRGPEIGAIFGFLTGLLVAMAVFEPLGLASLVLVIVGYVAGRYAERSDPSSGLAPIITVLVGTALGLLMYAMAQFLLDRHLPAGYFIGRVFLPALVLNALLAAPAYISARLWLREGMGDARPA